MNLFFYNFSIRAYHFLIWLFSFFNKKAKLFISGRRRTFHLLREKFSGNQKPVAWFHCASLGEFEQGRPIIERFKEEFPHYRILLTFFSPSGYEIRKNYEYADMVCYLPQDSRKNAQQFIALAQPAIAFFVKYEFWYHFANELHKKNIPTISFSAIFRKEQPFFKWYGGLMRQTLQKFSHIFVQNQLSQDLLQSIDIKNVSICGDTRFDRVYAIRESKKEILIAKNFKNNKLTMVVGSSWKEDIEVLAVTLRQFPYALKLIIAPHEISESNIQFIEKQFSNKKTIRFTQQEVRNSEQVTMNKEQETKQADILIIDNIGMLSSLYQYGEFAFVGGGFKQGLHNILEPAVFGMPIFFGNKVYQKFDEAINLAKIGVGVPMGSAEGLKTSLSQLIENQEERDVIAMNCLNFVKENLGASNKILAYLKSTITTI